MRNGPDHPKLKSAFSARQGRLDRRTREARRSQQVISDLTAHLGGSPTAAERLLIEEIAALRLRLDLMNRRLAEQGGDIDAREHRRYMGVSAAYERLIRRLGLKGAPPRAPTLAELLAARDAEEASADE